MSKWIEFADCFLKKKDIDSFRLSLDFLEIFCFFHQGMDYQSISEKFTCIEDSEKRFYEILKILNEKDKEL